MGALAIIGIIVVSIMLYLAIGYAMGRLLDDRNLIFKDSYADDEELNWIMVFWVFVLLFVGVREGGIQLYKLMGGDKDDDD